MTANSGSPCQLYVLSAGKVWGQKYGEQSFIKAYALCFSQVGIPNCSCLGEGFGAFLISTVESTVQADKSLQALR